MRELILAYLTGSLFITAISAPLMLHLGYCFAGKTTPRLELKLPLFLFLVLGFPWTALVFLAGFRGWGKADLS